MKILISRVGVFVCMATFLVVTVHTQDRIRTLEFGKYRKYDLASEPVEIIHRAIGSKAFQTDSTVVGGPNWLEEMTLTLKNISGKNITQCQLHVIIEDPAKAGQRTTMLLGFPSADIIDPNGKQGEPLRIWKPGQELNLRLPTDQLRALEDMKRNGVASIDTASLAIHSVRFDDGTGWLQGVPLREDPSAPGRMVPNKPKKMVNGRELGQAAANRVTPAYLRFFDSVW